MEENKRSFGEAVLMMQEGKGSYIDLINSSDWADDYSEWLAARNESPSSENAAEFIKRIESEID